MRLSFDMVFSTLPRSGSSACVSLSRASFAEPPAESPSTRNSSLREMSSEAQSTSLPGSVAMPLDFLRSTFLPLARRASACSIASSTIFLPSSGVLVQPQLEGVAHAHLQQLRGVARGELLLGLAVELRAHDARREREAGALPEVVRDQLHALGLQRARVHERGERVEDAGAEARLVRAARARRDQVDVAVGEDVALGDPADRPRGALARLDRR